MSFHHAGATLAAGVLCVLSLSPAVAGQSKVGQLEGKRIERIEIHKDAVNRALPSLRDAVAALSRTRPNPKPPKEMVNFRGKAVPTFSDPESVLMSTRSAQSSQGTGNTTLVSSFPAMSNNDNGQVLGYIVAPPDTDGSVGPNHFVQMINSLTAIYDKNGNALSGPFASNTFWSGQGGNCEPNNQGDPIVLYDDVADRWLVSQFAFPDNLSTFSQCVAISQTGDPLGGYNRYEFNFDNFGFNDYPKHGIVSDSITMIANLFRKRGGGPRAQFNFAGTFLGVMDKNAMYAGQSASLLGFNLGTGEFGFVAGDLDGTGSSPALFATAMSNASSFDIWEIDVDWNTETASANQIAAIPVTPFDADLCSATREACIPQPNGGPAFEAISDRLMHRLQIRDFGSYRTMITAHTVDVGSGRAGIRWYEFRETGGSWSLYQEGTFGPTDGENRWMASAAMNGAGDIGIGYLLGSANTFMSTAVAGQTAANSGTGLLDSAEVVCAPGSGVQLDTGRSGDYSSTSIDPTTGYFWHTNELVASTGQFNWSTAVCEFYLGAGTPPPNNPPTAAFSSSCTDLTCDFTDTSSDSDGSVTGWAWDFGDGTTSTAQNPSHTYGADGTYTVSLTATDDDGDSDSASSSVTVSVSTGNTPPTASFTFSCTDLDCSFTDTSSDSDGTVTGWAWDFGDGGTSSAQNPSYSYAAAGTYTVTLTATDDGGDSDSASDSVTVTDPPTGGNITLSAVGFKVRGRQQVDLTWSGASSSNVDVYRDGSVITTTANDGFYNDNIGRRGGATYVYQVCEAGTSNCSNTATVVF